MPDERSEQRRGATPTQSTPGELPSGWPADPACQHRSCRNLWNWFPVWTCSRADCANRPKTLAEVCHSAHIQQGSEYVHPNPRRE